MTFSPSMISRRSALLGGVLGGIGAAVAGCDAGHNLPALPDYQTRAYLMGPGDQLRILTFGEEQLTGEFKVDDQGQIAVPLIGSIPAAGKTAAQLESDISRALVKGDYLKNPHVTVEVIAYRPIFVLGEVSKPGQYPYQPGMTFLTAVAIAGGFTYRAVKDYGEVVRATRGVATTGRVGTNTFLAPGDVVQVLERYF